MIKNENYANLTILNNIFPYKRTNIKINYKNNNKPILSKNYISKSQRKITNNISTNNKKNSNSNSKFYSNNSNKSILIDDESQIKLFKKRLRKTSLKKCNLMNKFNSLENSKKNSYLKGVSKSQSNFSFFIPKIKKENSSNNLGVKINKIKQKKNEFDSKKVLHNLYKNETFYKFIRTKSNVVKSKLLNDSYNEKKIKKIHIFIEICNSIINKIKEIYLKYFILKTQIIAEKREKKKLKKTHSFFFPSQKKYINREFTKLKKDINLKKKKKTFEFSLIQKAVNLYKLNQKLTLFDNVDDITAYKQRYYFAKKLGFGWDDAYAYEKKGRNIIRNSSKYINENKEYIRKKIKLVKPDSFLI